MCNWFSCFLHLALLFCKRSREKNIKMLLRVELKNINSNKNYSPETRPVVEIKNPKQHGTWKEKEKKNISLKKNSSFTLKWEKIVWEIMRIIDQPCFISIWTWSQWRKARYMYHRQRVEIKNVRWGCREMFVKSSLKRSLWLFGKFHELVKEKSRLLMSATGY